MSGILLFFEQFSFCFIIVSKKLIELSYHRKNTLGWGSAEKYTLATVDPFGDENVGRILIVRVLKIKGAFAKCNCL